MPVTDLQHPPTNESEMLRWAFANRVEHQRIRARIQALGGPNLTDYQLEPINFGALHTWLRRHQAAHREMEAVAGIQSFDLETVDFQDQKEFETWIAMHYQSHFDVNSVLKL